MSHTTSSPAPAYDAVSTLGFGPASLTPFPQAKPGELLIRYGGWSLRELRDSATVREKDILWEQDWYNGYAWSTEHLPSGLYVLRLPIPTSNRKTFVEQKALLLPGEEPVPVVLAASAMLAHLVSTGERLMQGQWLRCKEQTDAGLRVELGWLDGRLYVNRSFDDDPDGNVWLASARRLPEPCPSSP